MYTVALFGMSFVHIMDLMCLLLLLAVLVHDLAVVCTCLRLAEWAKAQPEKERKKALEKARKREMLLSGGPKHFFSDSEYMQQLEATEGNVDSALRQGLQTASANSRGKRKADTVIEPHPSKKSKAW